MDTIVIEGRGLRPLCHECHDVIDSEYEGIIIAGAVHVAALSPDGKPAGGVIGTSDRAGDYALHRTCFLALLPRDPELQACGLCGVKVSREQIHRNTDVDLLAGAHCSLCHAGAVALRRQITIAALARDERDWLRANLAATSAMLRAMKEVADA